MTTLPQTTPIRVPRALPTAQHLAMPAPMMLGSAQAPNQSSLTPSDVWRVIRANIWLILAMLALSAAAGYGINRWLGAHYSRYTSTGYLQVKLPEERYSLGNGAAYINPQELEIEQTTQAHLLTSEGLMTTVLAQSEPLRQTQWFDQFKYIGSDGRPHVDSEAAKLDLMDHLEVIAIPNSRLVRISMSWRIPRDCQTIVEQVADQHIKEQREAASIAQVDQTHSLESLKQSYETQITEMNNSMIDLAKQLGAAGVGIGGGGNSKEFELQQLITEQLNALRVQAAAESKLKTFDREMETNSAPQLEEARQKSPTYNEYRRTVDQLQGAYNEMLATLGPSNQRTQQIKRELDFMQGKLDDTRDDIESRTSEYVRSSLLDDRTSAAAQLSRINDRLKAIRDEIAALAQKSNEYMRLDRQVQVLRGTLDRVNDEQNKIGFLQSNDNWARVAWQRAPDLPDHPTFPKLSVIMSISIALGLALSLGIAFLRELTDNSVRTPRDIARVGHLALLGMIPHESDDPQAAGARLPLVIFEAPHSMIAEQFRQVRTRLQHTASLDTTRSILVTSCSPEDGKTTVAANLAAGLALNGRRILLVDANFRRPNIHNVFNLPNEIGFGDVLNSLEYFQDAVHETEVPNLSVLSTGQKPSNPTELLESQLLIDFIERALEEYDHVIFDSGPLLMVSDSIALAPRVDGVITVVRARGNSRGMLTRLRDELRRLKAEHLGVVLNAVRVHNGGYYGPMIKSHYAYQNG